MLWPPHRLLISLIAIFFYLAGISVSKAQSPSEEETAPWRIEANELVEPAIDYPLDLNQATEEELSQAPGLTPNLAAAIIRYRSEHGPFVKLVQVRNIDDISADIYRQIQPFLEVRDETSRSRLQLILRFSQKTPPGDKVQQSPFGVGQKMYWTNPGRFEVRLAGEKDAGETRFLDYTAFSGRLYLPQLNSSLVLGDFTVEYSAGIIIRTVRSYGLGLGESGLKSPGLKPYAGWDESRALRGAGFEYRGVNLSWSLWSSSRVRDAHLNSLGQVTSFDNSGLHRTIEEEASQDVCREDAWGFQANYLMFSLLRLGITFSAISWDHPLVQESNIYSLSSAGGINLAFEKSNVSAAVDAAWDRQGHSAQCAQFGLRHSAITPTALVYRLEPDYFAPLASILDLNMGQVCNREGVYLSLEADPAKVHLTSFLHVYRYPVRSAGESWGGRDIGILMRGRPWRKLSASALSRWTFEEALETLETLQNWRGTGSLSAELGRAWTLSTKLQLCQTPTVRDLGRLLQFGLQHNWDWFKIIEMNLNLQAGIYAADDYSERLFWTDRESSGYFQVKSLWHQGKIAQVSLHGEHRRWGQLEGLICWDEPNAESEREAEKVYRITYGYP